MRKTLNNNRICRYVIFFLLPVLIIQISCNKKSTGNDENNLTSFSPPLDGTAWMYEVDWDPQGNTQFHMMATVVGEDDTTFPGESYTRIEMFDTTQSELLTGLILWLDASTEYQMGYKAAEVYLGFLNNKKNKQQSQVWDQKYVADVTTYSIFDGTVDELVTVTSTGYMFFDGGDVGEPTTLIAQVTVASLNASTTVPYGTVNNCVKLTGTGTETMFGHTYEFPLEFYLSPTLGIVSVNMMPGFTNAKLMDFYPVA